MLFAAPGRFRTVESFAEHAREVSRQHSLPELGLVDPTSGRDGPLGQRLDLGGLRIGNRFAVHPMEGWDGTADGLPTEHTLRRWYRFGRSTAKLIWGGEAFAVQEDGRANPGQLFLNPAVDVKAALASLREEVLRGHREQGESIDDLVLGLQLTHSGRFSRPHGARLEPRLVDRHAVLERKYQLPADLPLLTDGELEGIAANYLRAASIAQQVGFQFVDVKACHGYLMHELLGARGREGPYGGDFSGRTRLFRRIVEGIQRDCPGLHVGVRVSLADVVPFHAGEDGVGAPMEVATPLERGFGLDRESPECFDLDEPLRFLELVQELGLRLVNVTLGSPYYNPHLQRPATYPPSDGYQPPEDPLAGVLRHLGLVRRAKEAAPGLCLVGSGYTYLQQFLPNVAESEVGQGHVDFVGLGRMILSYPEMPADVLAGRELQRKLICRTFSDCTTAPRNQMISGCFPLDDHYKAMPEAARMKEVKKGLRSGKG